jgi:hypothetical protein
MNQDVKGEVVQAMRRCSGLQHAFADLLGEYACCSFLVFVLCFARRYPDFVLSPPIDEDGWKTEALSSLFSCVAYEEMNILQYCIQNVQNDQSANSPFSSS